MVEVDVADSDPVQSQQEDENLSDTERFDLDDFTFISSEAAQEVGEGPAEKSDSEEEIRLPPKKDKKKKRAKKPKKVSEPVEGTEEATSPPGSPVPKPKKKRIKRTRSDSDEEAEVVEEEEEEEEEEDNDSDYDSRKKKKKRSKGSESESGEEEEDEKPAKRKKRSDRKRSEELDNLASIKKSKEKRTQKGKEKARETKKARHSIEIEDNNEEPEEGSESEPEDTEVVPVSTFLSDFRPRPSSSLLVPEDDGLLKRRSKFGELLAHAPPPSIVPFERPRLKTSSQHDDDNNTNSNGTNSNNKDNNSNNNSLQITGTNNEPEQPKLEQHELEQLYQQQLAKEQSAQRAKELLQQQLKHRSDHHQKDKDKHKRRKEKEKEREKQKREKEKKKKKEKEKEKANLPKLDPSTPQYAAKRKEFKIKLSESVGVRLKKYLRANRIASKEDFKHLARKFTHKIMTKEDAKSVFAFTSKTEEKLHKVIDAYFERHTTYNRGTPAPGSDNHHSPSTSTSVL